MARNLSREEVLGGLLHRIGNFNPAQFDQDFNQRLIVQKTIYLMQQFDLYIGYDFNWYLRGPYSPSLTRDSYQILRRYGELPQIGFTDPEAEARFQRFLTFASGRLHDHDWLEAVASIQYLHRRTKDNDPETIYRRIKEKKPAINRRTFDEAWAHLDSFGLLEATD
jgi:uncharacterized protein YwgA